MRNRYKKYLFSFFSLATLLIGLSGTGVAFARSHSPLASSHRATMLACAGWSIVASPNVGSGSNQLVSAAAVSANNVWAVGNYTDGSKAYQTLIEYWNGTSWRVVSSPNVGQGYNFLYGVAAVSSSDGWAVGDYYTSSDTSQTLIEHWNGTSWRVVSSPNLGPGSNVLVGVAAVSSSDVWAVGSYNSSKSVYQTLIEHWNGTSWNVIPSPNVGSYTNSFISIAAVSASDVWAIGDYYDSSLDRDQPLIEQWNGTQWRIWNNVGGYLFSVATVSSSDVWAVGYYQLRNGVGQTLSKHWNGMRWNVVSSPNVGDDSFYGVAAVSSNDVWAVGFNSIGQTVIEQWKGTSWSVVPSPNIASSTNSLYSVTTISTGDAWAVGYYYNSTIGRYQTLIEFYC